MPPNLKIADALAMRRHQQKMCHRRRYNTIKNDPEMLEIERIKRRQRYLKQKDAKKEKSFRDLKEQRKKWRENSKRYRQRKKEETVEEEKVTPFETIHIQALADKDHTEAEEPDIKIGHPLPYCPQIQAEVKKFRQAELQKRKKLLRIIATLKEREKLQIKHIEKLKRKLLQMRAMHSSHESQLDSNDSGSEERESPIMENVNSVIRTSEKKIITRKQKRVSKKKKPQRGWVFVGPVKDKPIKFKMADVKEEPKWETDSGASQQVTRVLTGDAEDACLPMDIEIKQEIEVGPVQLQPQDIYYSYKDNKDKLKKC